MSLLLNLTNNDPRVRSVDPRGGVYTSTLPTTGWTSASYGAYIDTTFSGASFQSSDLLFADLNTTSELSLEEENVAWGAVLQVTPQENSNIARVKVSKIPTVELPMRVWVAQKAAVELTYDGSVTQMLQAVYPIGSIYMSVNSTSPATLFGFGTWEQIEDTFLLGAGQSYTAGASGGEATHTLTEAELPVHEHAQRLPSNEDSTESRYWSLQKQSTNEGSYKVAKNLDVWSSTVYNPLYTKSAGSGQAHNNMPPYLAVYIWKRVS